MVPLVGPVGTGAFVDAILLGCLIVQSCVYYKNTRGDGWLLKILVSLILFLLLSHLSCTIAWLWASTDTGNASLPGYATILFGVSNACGATISFLARCFFSHRILRASKNHFLSFLLLVFCVFSFTVSFGAATTFFTNENADPTNQLDSDWIFLLLLTSGLACDLAINISAGVYHVCQTSVIMEDTLDHVARLLLVIAETGSIASFFGAATIVVYCLTRTNFVWVSLIVCMPGVFANAVLAALNARGKLDPEIEHQRACKIGLHSMIDDHAKRPPILIAISKRVDKESERSPV